MQPAQCELRFTPYSKFTLNHVICDDEILQSVLLLSTGTEKKMCSWSSQTSIQLLKVSLLSFRQPLIPLQECPGTVNVNFLRCRKEANPYILTLKIRPES